MPKKQQERTIASQLKSISKQKQKKERFIRTRMWFSTLIAAMYHDRGSIPANIGNNLLIGNNIYITKNALNAVIMIREMSTDTPVAFISELINAVKSKVPDVTVDFTMKNQRHHFDVNSNDLKSRINNWTATLEAPMVPDVHKRRAARLLYTVDIARSGEQLYRSQLYIIVRAKTGSQLNKGVEQACAYLGSIGAVYKVVKNDMRTHLDLMLLMSDHRSATHKDFATNVMSRQTIAEILPDTQGMNDDRGTFLGIDQKMMGPYFINFRSTAKAKNIICAAGSGVGKTFLVQNWFMDMHATGFNMCIMDIKGTEFTAFTKAKTRVLAIRPGAGEYWAVFLRKFNIKNVTLEKLYCKPGIDPPTANIPIELIKWFMIGRVTCAFTGRQGTGKTTAMIAAIAAIDARLTIRILEMAPEMYLRERYPDRNIYSVSETQYVTAAELQDALKKSDAAVSIVGEVATDAIAARMIQMGQVASLFTIFSHHANRAKDLINAITNSIVASNGGGATTATIQPQVIDVIKIDIHMDFDVTGFRYFERITEIIPVDREIEPYNPKDPDSLAKIMREYFEITAVGELFTTQDIIRFDRETRSYVPVKWCSERLTEYMLKNIPKEQVEAFTEFVTSNWKE